MRQSRTASSNPPLAHPTTENNSQRTFTRPSATTNQINSSGSAERQTTNSYLSNASSVSNATSLISRIRNENRFRRLLSSSSNQALTNNNVTRPTPNQIARAEAAPNSISSLTDTQGSINTLAQTVLLYQNLQPSDRNGTQRNYRAPSQETAPPSLNDIARNSLSSSRNVRNSSPSNAILRTNSQTRPTNSNFDFGANDSDDDDEVLSDASFELPPESLSRAISGTSSFRTANRTAIPFNINNSTRLSRHRRDDIDTDIEVSWTFHLI
jgi:hypothetical protein